MGDKRHKRKKVMEGTSTLNNYPISINTEELMMPGTYILLLYTEQGQFAKKLVIYD